MSGVGLGIAGLALSAGGMGMSLGQAAKARRARKEAEMKAKAFRNKAIQKAEKDFYAGLNVPLDAFGEQYRQQMQSQQQGIQALQEGDSRNLAAGLGGLQAATNQAQETTRIGMQDALYENAKMKADAKENMKQQLIDIDMAQAKDMAAMQQQYGQQEAQGIQGAITAAGSMLSAANDIAPLFGTSKADRLAGKAYVGAEDAGVDFSGVQKRKNPNYDPNAAAGTPESQMFMMDDQGGQLFNTLSRAQATNLLKKQNLSRQDIGALKKGQYKFPSGNIGGFDSDDFALFFNPQ